MSDLAEEACVPCRGGVLALTRSEFEPLLRELAGWEVVDDQRLRRRYDFKNFKDALAWVNRVSELAETQNHHPNISFTWGQVVIEIWTHKVNGLTKSDFVLAAKIDALRD